MTDYVLRKNAPCTPQQAAVLIDGILNMLVTDMRPLSMVEDQGFRTMINILNPGYTLPARTHFTKLMERKYQKTFQEVKSAIKATNSRIGLTTDVWTSVATEAYLGITCHYIGDDWNMKSICLTTMPLEHRHTASNIAEWLEEVVARFEIIAIVHDNGANIVAAANILEEKHGWSSIRCTGHTLQLVINSSLKNTTAEHTTPVSLLNSLLEFETSSEEENRKEEAEDDLNSQVRNKVLTYFGEKSLAKEENPLHWWKTNEDRYPTLARPAESYLCIPGTSTPSERLFSAAGNIASKKRASLSPEHVDMLTFLHCNAKFLQSE
ncbi:hypothetical protein SKAU_G00274890 [Synaphobranchus kaupii]|uniref:HAT C-terminal dimerisation domain-containing protein n=1 Tax=Synaphobranchus kaupii TaxID=118154 RepID=A0A9Q1IQ25_SYNKA|nr:hypothetical protein SKAU_G00274890 [Synaphobranchus kaupii]